MDTTGRFEVYEVLSMYRMLTCLSKFYSLDDYKAYYEKRGKPLDPDLFMVTVGIREGEFERMSKIVEFTKCPSHWHLTHGVWEGCL